MSDETGNCPQLSDDRMATGHDHPHGLKPSPHPASLTCAPPVYPNQGQTAASKNTRDLFEHAKAQRIYMRGVRAEARYQVSFEAGVFAARDLSSHMWKSLPWHLQAKVTILRGFWFSVHYKVATLALRQVQQSARRLGLTRVADTTDFLSKNCRWYRYFCSFSQFISTTAGWS